jgi:DNA repair/transcription protein MET18/MMS19
VQALWDSFFQYFPITFKPPPDNPYKITAQDLKGRVRDCISANDAFAQFAFTQLIDKLDTNTSLNVKKDVILTLAACSQYYSPVTMAKYSIYVWDSLKFEVVSAQDPELADDAIVAIKAIGERLSFGLTQELLTPKIPLVAYLNDITKFCADYFESAEVKSAKPATQLLSAVAATSSMIFNTIVKALTPKYLQLYASAKTDLGKASVLMLVLSAMLGSAKSVFGSISTPGPFPANGNEMDTSKTQLFELTVQLLGGTPPDEVAAKSSAVAVLTAMTQLRRFLSAKEIERVIRSLTDLSLESETSTEVEEKAVQSLAQISRSHPNLILETTFPAFLSKLPDNDSQGPESYETDLLRLTDLCVTREMVQLLVRRLLSKLDTVLQSESTSDYAAMILIAIRLTLTNIAPLDNNPDLDFYYQKLVKGLVERTQRDTLLNGEACFQAVAGFIIMVVRAKDLEAQKALRSDFWEALLPVNHEDPKVAVDAHKIQTSAPDIRRRSLFLEYSMAAVRPGVCKSLKGERVISNK